MNLQESRIEALQNIAEPSRSVRCFVADLFLCCRKEKNVVNCNCHESCKLWVTIQSHAKLLSVNACIQGNTGHDLYGEWL